MRAITETQLREEYKKDLFTSYTLPKDCRLTPSAVQFLNERKIPVLTAPAVSVGQGTSSTSDLQDKKQASMNHHPRIKFRCKMDFFEALVIDRIIGAESAGYHQLGRDLRDILAYVRQILRAEAAAEVLLPVGFHGWSAEEIQERFLNPEKYFGINHLQPNPEHGELMSKLNLLRTQARELELIASDAFAASPEKVEREDIVQGLNVLSCLFYLMMIQLVSGHYRVGC